MAYIMLEGTNTSADHAKAMAGLLKERGSRAHLFHVDLIPCNQTDKAAYHAASHRSIQSFREILVSKDVSVTVRAQFGSGIGAACGQLRADKAIGKQSRPLAEQRRYRTKNPRSPLASFSAFNPASITSFSLF